MNMLNPGGSVRKSYTGVETGNEESYVNQFVVVDRKINGTVWTDTNEDGNIGGSERLWSGQSVKAQVKNASGAWADANDYAGVPLAGTTDANGKYSFSGLLPGNYRIVTQIPENYRVTTAKNAQTPTWIPVLNWTHS